MVIRWTEHAASRLNEIKETHCSGQSARRIETSSLNLQRDSPAQCLSERWQGWKNRRNARTGSFKHSLRCPVSHFARRYTNLEHRARCSRLAHSLL